MTPEEHFERIDKTLDRIAEARAEDERRRNIWLSEQAAQTARWAAEREARLREHEARHAEHEARHAEHEARHEAWRKEHEATIARIERICEFIANNVHELTESMRRHTNDGHGGEEES